MKKIFLLLFFAQIIFFVIIPPFQIPDEPGHYENVYWLKKGKYPYQVLKKEQEYDYFNEEMIKYYPTQFSLDKIKDNPLRKKIKSDFETKIPKDYQPINFQAYHPFFYYLILTPSQFIADILKVDLITRFYLTRFLSAIFFWLIFFFVYKILKIYQLPINDQKTFFLLYGLNPLVLFYSIGINPDVGVTIFSTFLLYLALKFKNKLSSKNIFILGIVSGICYLNKTSGIFSLFFIFLLLLFKNWSLLKKIKKYFFFLIVFLITISPWIYISLSRYHTLTTPAFHIAHQAPLQPHGFFAAAILALYEFRHTIMHYSPFLGAQNHIWPNKFYFSLYTFIVSMVFLYGFVNFFKKYLILSLYLLSSVFFFFILGFYFKKIGFLWDLQGRYFLLSFFSFYFFVFLGAKKILKKKSDLIISAFAIINLLAIVFTLIIPRFYPHQNILHALNILYPDFSYLFIFGLSGFLITIKTILQESISTFFKQKQI